MQHLAKTEDKPAEHHLVQVTFSVDPQATEPYRVSVTAGTSDVEGSPKTIDLLEHITQPADWQISGQNLSGGVLTGTRVCQMHCHIGPVAVVLIFGSLQDNNF